ncbi:MAG: PDZ domain-containing protein [Planctomycetes bacterium]|nr:PDZ domain-containing protein [Planctomycetota bacterium]
MRTSTASVVSLAFVFSFVAVLRGQESPPKETEPAGQNAPPTEAEPPAETVVEAEQPVEAVAEAKQVAEPETESAEPEMEPETEPETAEPVLPQIDPTLPDSWIDSFTWRSIGPAVMGGRITDIAVYEADPTIYWVASASGGLLKTTNSGITFEHQFDHEATVSIGAVAVAQSDSNIVWVGTGESNPRNSVSWGDGVYKSTDGGKTWTNMGLKESFQIGAIAIDPINANVVYVGALGRLWGPNEERGLFKTEDGGETWNKVLYVDENTGVIDVQMHPADPYTLLVATYERRRDATDANSPIVKWGDGGGIYKTTDGGQTFAKVTNGLPNAKLGRIGLDYYRKDPNVVYAVVESEKIGTEPENAAYFGVRGEDADVGARITEVTEDSPAEEAELKVGDIVISVEDTTIHSYNDLLKEMRRRLAGDTVKMEISRERKSVDVEITFAMRPGAEEDTETEEGQRPQRRRQQRSPFGSGLGGQRENMQDQQGPDGTDYGGVYKSTDGGENWTRINSVNPRPMYYSQVRVDPSDNNYLYVLGTSLYRSKDGGETFTADGGSNRIHVDHHALWIDPNDGRHMVLGNDGGLFLSCDRMENWDHLNHFAIGQFYHVTVDSRRNYKVYGGLQDNGTWGGPSRVRNGRGPINEDWFRVGGGDGFVCAVDRDDPDWVYYESQNGGFGRRNLATGERGSARARAPRGTRYRFNWKSPFILSNHNPRIYYNAGNYVFRSLDRGTSLKVISPEISLTDKGAATALAESPVDSDVLYVGTNDGALWVTTNGGHEWTSLVPKPDGDEGESEDQTTVVAVDRGHGDRSFAGNPQRRGGGAGGAGRSGRGGRGGRGMGGMLERLDANKDGKIQRSEAPDRMGQFFDRLDTNGDGALDEKELQAMGRNRGGQRSGPPPQRSHDDPPPTSNGHTNGNGLNPSPDDPQDESDTQSESESQDEKSTEAQDEKQTESQDEAQDVDADTKQEAAKETEAQAQPEATVEVSEAEGDAAQAAVVDDPVTGIWEASFATEQFSGEFTMTLRLGADGKTVTGSMDSNRGGGDIVDGRFDAKNNKIRFSIERDFGSMDYEATITGSQMRGDLVAGGGMFSADFEASRTSTNPDSASSEQADATPDDEYDWKPFNELIPGPRWVSSIEASRYEAGRAYVTLDGHRFDDDEPYVFVTENHGKTWRSLRANLSASVGSTRVIREDIENANVLYLGCEFGAWVSIDRGETWTKLNNNLPTVAVHEIAIHPTAGEIVAATHGRSLWVLDVTALRQMSAETVKADAQLYKPGTAIQWRSQPGGGAGTARRFTGQNPSPGAQLFYSLNGRARDVSLKITDAAGKTIRELEASADAGLHHVGWDLRRPAPQRRAGGQRGRGGFGSGGRRFGGRRGPAVAPGTYRVVLTVDDKEFVQELVVAPDPEFPNSQFALEDEAFIEESDEAEPWPIDRID